MICHRRQSELLTNEKDFAEAVPDGDRRNTDSETDVNPVEREG